jgi:hypothetical protein
MERWSEASRKEEECRAGVSLALSKAVREKPYTVRGHHGIDRYDLVSSIVLCDAVIASSLVGVKGSR